MPSFLLCSAWSHTPFEKAAAVKKLARDGFVSKRSITHAILGLFQEAYKPAYHAYSTVVDSFVIVSFFSWETLYSAVLSFTYTLCLCQIMPMFWSRCKVVVIFGVIKPIPSGDSMGGPGWAMALPAFCLAHVWPPSLFLNFPFKFIWLTYTVKTTVDNFRPAIF